MNQLLIAASALGLLTVSAHAAHVLTAGDLNATFDFQTYTGAGFAPAASVTAGQLPTDAYAVGGLSDGNVNFGGTGTTGDFARGTSPGGVTTGGLYAFTTGTDGSNTIFGFQPTATDFNPGSVYINVVNNTAITIDSFSLSYDIFTRNDQGRSSFLNFSFAVATVNTTDGSGTDPSSLTYTALTALNFTSPEAADATPAFFVTQRSTTSPISVSVADQQSIVLRFMSADVGGSGSRDELGLDNISLTATVVPEPSTVAMLMGGFGLLTLLRRRRA